MFWKSGVVVDKSVVPPAAVGRKLVELMQKMPHASDHWVRLKAIMRLQEGKTSVYDVRVFDEYDADQKKVKITNWASLDQNPDLVQYDGWYDTKSKKAEMKVVQQPTAPAAKAAT